MLKRVIFSGYLKTQVSALWLVCGVLVNRSSFWSLCSCCPPVKVSSVVFIFNFGNENCKSVSLITEITCYAFLRKWKWKSRGISSSYVEKSSEKFYIKVLPRIRQEKCPWWWDIWIFPINCSQPYLIFWLIANIKIQNAFQVPRLEIFVERNNTRIIKGFKIIWKIHKCKIIHIFRQTGSKY